jgi:pyrroloquinoline-quinone synthase
VRQPSAPESVSSTTQRSSTFAPTKCACAPVLDRTAFVERLRSVGAQRYHDKHPFHVAMHDGRLSSGDIRTWVANRYYYQKSLPVKDAAILSNLPDRSFRRRWIQRIIDHDGTSDGGGGIDMWLALSRAVGLSEEMVLSERRVHARTRAAVDSYVAFARSSPWLLAVASSLTELFAPELMARRVAALARMYPWIDQAGLQYFRARIDIAPKDSQYALAWVCEFAGSAELQSACVDALRFKCDVLWEILDATTLACREMPA